MADQTSVTAAAAGTIGIGGDLTVNRLGFGAMRITGRGIWGAPPDRDAAKAVLRRAVELGVNLIDTADSYGPHVSETLIAEALYPYPDDLVVATKGGLERTGPWQWPSNGRPEHLKEACESSLRRLKLDQIPLYQLHRPDPAVPLEESVGALVELREQGKIRHLGLSNVTEEQLRQAQRLTAIVSIQNRYNLDDRVSDSLIDLCEQEAMAFLPWAPIQDLDHNPALREIAGRHRATARQVVLAWLLARSPTVLPIPGTGTVAHLEDNLAAAGLQLSAAEVDALSTGATLSGPGR
jgi:pyridoxine 4-dehydrogenase